MSNVFTINDANPALDLREIERRQHERLDALYGEWLVSQGRAVAPLPDTTLDDEIVADERRQQLVTLIAGAPAPKAALVVRKLEILERLLETRQYAEEEGERPEFLLIAGIRADLVRLAAR